MVSDDARAAQLFLTHHLFVRGMALRHAPWPGLTDGIIQQTFVEFLAKSTQWNLDDDIWPLLAAMTCTVALRNWRERARATGRHPKTRKTHPTPGGGTNRTPALRR